GAQGGVAPREERPHEIATAESGGAHRAHPRHHHATRRAHRPKSRLTFWPPKPNELVSATSIGAGRATLGTQSNGISGSTSARLGGGGIKPWCRARMLATASRLPAAAIVCPTSDLVELIGTLPAPSTRAIASASVRSFWRVPVPCALT